MMTIIILLILLVLVYAVLRLFEFGAVKGWQRLRDRQRGDEVIVVKGGDDGTPRRPRPQLKREEAADAAPEDS